MPPPSEEVAAAALRAPALTPASVLAYAATPGIGAAAATGESGRVANASGGSGSGGIGGGSGGSSRRSGSGGGGGASGSAGGWVSSLRAGYEEIVAAIIRPPRAQYALSALGPRSFEFRGVAIARRDYFVLNSRGMRLACSYWAPAALPSTSSEPPPCVVFLHGNASSRVGALEALETVLACGAALAAFDCAGSGLSEGDYVTLGWSERDDVAAIVAHLRGAGLAGAVALWGRSMGAAAALMHAPRDPSLAGLVLDSPFADLRQLANELIDAGRGRVPYHVPGIVVGTALRMVRASVRQRTGMDIFDLSPLREAPRSFVPAVRTARAGLAVQRRRDSVGRAHRAAFTPTPAHCCTTRTKQHRRPSRHAYLFLRRPFSAAHHRWRGRHVRAAAPCTADLPRVRGRAGNTRRRR